MLIRILDSESQITNKILNAIAQDYNKTIISSLSELKSRVKDLTYLYFKTTPTYQALGEELEGHFGFPAGTGLIRAEFIIKAVVNSLVVENIPVKVVGNGFSGVLTLKMLRTSLEEMWSLPSDIIEVDNNGQRLPWLRWLLEYGNDIVISKHEIQFGTNLPGSRSGQAVMIKSAGVWRVPPQYSGTTNDNWLTRTLYSKDYFSLLKLAIHSIILKNVR